MVLPNYTPALNPGNNSKEELIETYFKQGYTNKEIKQCLSGSHDIHLSLSQIKRILKKLSLKRRPDHVDFRDVIAGILKITENSGQCLGYRTIWKRLTTELGIVIQRQKVMELMRIIDPDGVARRKQRRLLRRQYACPGPNYIWHIDGYDKLKPFGFAIHGAIDGFSRRILWLEVGPSNNNPRIIAKYFLDTVQQLGGCPMTCRCDLGTENAQLEEIQVLLHSINDAPNASCFLYGKSTSNQRIESWWSILRRQTADWWITFFKDLRDTHLFNDSDPLHIDCIRYCFMNVLQDELHKVVVQWNQHRMQAKKNCDNPKGKPDILFFTPRSCNALDYKVTCDQDDVLFCQEHYGEERPLYGCSEDFIELAHATLPEHLRPTTVEEAADLYGQFTAKFEQYDSK